VNWVVQPPVNASTSAQRTGHWAAWLQLQRRPAQRTLSPVKLHFTTKGICTAQWSATMMWIAHRICLGRYWYLVLKHI